MAVELNPLILGVHRIVHQKVGYRKVSSKQKTNEQLISCTSVPMGEVPKFW